MLLGIHRTYVASLLLACICCCLAEHVAHFADHLSDAKSFFADLGALCQQQAGAPLRADLMRR